MLTSKRRSRLSALAQPMPDLVQLGRDGASPALVARLATLLSEHELVKLRFVDHKGEREALARDLAGSTGSELVRVIGNTALFWKPNPDPAKRRVDTGPESR